MTFLKRKENSSIPYSSGLILINLEDYFFPLPIIAFLCISHNSYFIEWLIITYNFLLHKYKGHNHRSAFAAVHFVCITVTFMLHLLTTYSI